MTVENQDNILHQRTDCILYHSHPAGTDEYGAGWIGGNAPAFFDNRSDLIHQGNSSYRFYLSLIHPFRPGNMLSIFIPDSYEDYLDNNMYPDCSIQVIEHPAEIESIHTTFTHPHLIKHTISRGKLSKDEESNDQPFLIKVGGHPRLIQQEDYYVAKLKEDSFSFLFQIDEEGYPETLLHEEGSYPFGFGALYIYAKIKAMEVEHPVAGFWQFS